MSRFRAQPTIIEAYQFKGTIQVFPVEWQPQIMQQYVGQRAFLPSSLNGGGYVEGEVKYSSHDAIEIGDWVYRGLGGDLRRMSAGEFDRSYVEIRDETAHVGPARWMGTYVGANDGSTPMQTSWLGYPWEIGKSVPMDDEAHARLVGSNAHFVVIDAFGERYPPADLAPLPVAPELDEDDGDDGPLTEDMLNPEPVFHPGDTIVANGVIVRDVKELPVTKTLTLPKRDKVSA